MNRSSRVKVGKPASGTKSPWLFYVPVITESCLASTSFETSVSRCPCALRTFTVIIAAHADSNRRRGKQVISRLIDSIRRGVPVRLEEIAQLGRTLWRRRNALGFRYITHYRIRSLLHSGALHAHVNAL
jgi:transposase